MKRMIQFMLLLACLGLGACSHTFEGIGKDLQELGKSIENSSKDSSKE